MNQKIVHCKRSFFDVYIGRPSKWGNPFAIGKDGTREEVIEKYKEWIISNPELLAQLPELDGKTLGCWCYPQKCHGEVLLELLEKTKTMSNEKQKPIGFLRNKTSKKGINFLTGSIEVNGEKIPLVVFQNTKKFSEDSPDYSMYVSQPLPAMGGGGAGQSGARVTNQPQSYLPKSAPVKDVSAFDTEDDNLFQ